MLIYNNIQSNIWDNIGCIIKINISWHDIRYLILIQVSNTYQNELRMYINNVTFQDLKLI